MDLLESCHSCIKTRGKQAAGLGVPKLHVKVVAADELQAFLTGVDSANSCKGTMQQRQQHVLGCRYRQRVQSRNFLNPGSSFGSALCAGKRHARSQSATDRPSRNLIDTGWARGGQGLK